MLTNAPVLVTEVRVEECDVSVEGSGNCVCLVLSDVTEETLRVEADARWRELYSVHDVLMDLYWVELLLIVDGDVISCVVRVVQVSVKYAVEEVRDAWEVCEESPVCGVEVFSDAGYLVSVVVVEEYVFVIFVSERESV